MTLSPEQIRHLLKQPLAGTDKVVVETALSHEQTRQLVNGLDKKYELLTTGRLF